MSSYNVLLISKMSWYNVDRILTFNLQAKNIRTNMLQLTLKYIKKQTNLNNRSVTFPPLIKRFSSSGNSTLPWMHSFLPTLFLVFLTIHLSILISAILIFKHVAHWLPNMLIHQTRKVVLSYKIFPVNLNLFLYQKQSIHSCCFFFITEESSMTKTLRRSMGSKPQGADRARNNQHWLNQGIINNRIQTWDHVPLTRTTPPSICPNQLGYPSGLSFIRMLKVHVHVKDKKSFPNIQTLIEFE